MASSLASLLSGNTSPNRAALQPIDVNELMRQKRREEARRTQSPFYAPPIPDPLDMPVEEVISKGAAAYAQDYGASPETAGKLGDVFSSVVQLNPAVAAGTTLTNAAASDKPESIASATLTGLDLVNPLGKMQRLGEAVSKALPEPEITPMAETPAADVLTPMTQPAEKLYLDSEGKPQTFYHGSRVGAFDRFEPTWHDETGLKGTAFVPDPRLARDYATNRFNRGEPDDTINPHIYEANLVGEDIPDVMDFYDAVEAHYGKELHEVEWEDIQKYAQDNGIHAVNMSVAGEPGEVFVLNPDAIKILQKTRLGDDLPGPEITPVADVLAPAAEPVKPKRVVGEKHPLSSINLRRPYAEMTSVTEPSVKQPALAPEKEFDFEAAPLGSLFTKLLGDRSEGGRVLTDINGMKINPVELEGGIAFIRRPDAFWASDKEMVQWHQEPDRRASKDRRSCPRGDRRHGAARG